MDLEKLRRNWEEFGRTDPYWAVLSYSSHEDGRWDVDEFLATGRAEVAELMSHVEAVGGCGRDRALDFGSGLGRLTQALADHFDQVLGVDIAASMVEEAASINRQADRCRFVVNTAPDLRLLEDGAVDLVYTSIVLQHMSPRLARGYVREFFRVARPGGIVAFTMLEPIPRQLLKVLVPERLLSLVRRLQGRTGPVMQLFGMRPASVHSLVESSGGSLAFVGPMDGGPGIPGHIYVARKTA